ncbi:MAG: 50S ribosomal protein L3 [Synergistaceae bacterium]|nr:50S ribosomal protein L3 [Synergistaceae bacterium]MCL2163992.1 50S ribosomal protein L3 [Oscillospiraceae bacterium]
MKKFILAEKIGMTQIFDETGLAIPVTVLKAGPCTVIQKKTEEDDGYSALKLGFSEIPEKKVSKPKMGEFKKVGVSPLKFIREFRTEDTGGFEVGQVINVSKMFSDGDMVDVSGISKGKGFQGAIKRHGQSIGRVSHGSKFHRGIGSMGANSYPGRIFKGKKMPGHMGGERVTIQNLSVVRVDPERDLMLIRGAVPGPKGTILTIKDTVKNA